MILHITNFQELYNILSQINKNDKTLVLFDVDETLITMKDKILRPIANKTISETFATIFLPLTDPNKQIKFGHYISQAQTTLMHPDMPKLINVVKSKNIKTFALTRMRPGAGKCGIVDSMEHLRFNELLKHGIDFRNTILDSHIVFELPVLKDRSSIYKDGIIYASPHKKSTVFEEIIKILKLSGHDIKTVYFVDDKRKFVEDVANSCKKLNIDYIGLHYVDHDVNNELLTEKDIEFGMFQFKHFNETYIWLDDSHNKIKD